MKNQSVRFRVKNNGTLAKVPINKFKTTSGFHANFGRLECLSCGNEYEANVEFTGERKGKILRDDRIY